LPGFFESDFVSRNCDLLDRSFFSEDFEFASLHIELRASILEVREVFFRRGDDSLLDSLFNNLDLEILFLADLANEAFEVLLHSHHSCDVLGEGASAIVRQKKKWANAHFSCCATKQILLYTAGLP